MGAKAQGILSVSILAVVVLAGIGAYHVWFRPPDPPVVIADRLCDLVHAQHLDCVAVISGAEGMRPGSIVESPDGEGARPSVAFPVADLFDGNRCLIEGAHLHRPTSDRDHAQPISIPTLTYDVDHGLHEGADVEVPKLAGMTFKAGPHWSDVSRVELSAAASWMSRLDEIAAVDAYGSCEVKSSCASYIRASHYRVVGSAMVADGLLYKVFDKADNLVSADVGAKSGKFALDVGAESRTKTGLQATVASADPRVIGVRLLPASVFAGHQACEGDFVVTPSASVSATLVGGGGKGSIAELRSARKPLGERLSLSAAGSEASQCDEGFERKRSGASIEAQVDAPSPGALDFHYAVAAQGGHYVTAAGCAPVAGGVVIGKTGHDTTATALAELQVHSSIILRGDRAPPIKVEYRQLPKATPLTLVDWQGRPLKIARRVIINNDNATVYDDLPQTVSGTGSFTVASHGPGVYVLDTVLRLDASVTGNADSAQRDSATIRLSPAP